MAVHSSPPYPGGVREGAERLAEHPWLDRLARIGYAAKGLLHALIGLLAFRAAVGAGGETTDGRGALRVVAEAPFGSVLLGICGVGLAAFSVWKILEAFVRDGDHSTRSGGHASGQEWKTALKRAGDVAAAGVYASFSMASFDLLRGRGTDGGGTQRGISTLLEQPFGTVLAFLAGVGVLAYGVSQIVKGFKGTFLNELRTERMDAKETKLAKRFGHVGLPARGLVLVVVGFFITRAGLFARADEARGVEGALDLFAQGPAGGWTLAAIALGLMAFAAYCFVAARFRRPLLGPGGRTQGASR